MAGAEARWRIVVHIGSGQPELRAALETMAREGTEIPTDGRSELDDLLIRPVAGRIERRHLGLLEVAQEVGQSLEPDRIVGVVEQHPTSPQERAVPAV